MRDIDTKSLGSKFYYQDCNSMASEEKNIVTSTGIALSEADAYQLAKAISVYSAAGAYYTDTGSANSYLLSPLGSLKCPPSYYEGMVVKFVAGNTNTTTSSINVNGIGVKNILTYNGNILIGGEIPAGRLTTLFYDGSVFRLSAERQQMLRPYVDLETEHTDYFGITFKIGDCTDSTKTVVLENKVAFVKYLNAVWTTGSGNGGFPSALTLTDDAWYHMFIIGKIDGTIDFGFDTSITAVNLLADATNFVYYRRIGSIRNGASSPVDIKGYVQVKNKFYWVDHQQFANAYTYTANTKTTIQLETPPDVVTGAYVSYGVNDMKNNQAGAYTMEPMFVDDYIIDNFRGKNIFSFNSTTTAGIDISENDYIFTDTNRQVWFKVQLNSGGTIANQFIFRILGWEEQF